MDFNSMNSVWLCFQFPAVPAADKDKPSKKGKKTGPTRLPFSLWLTSCIRCDMEIADKVKTPEKGTRRETSGQVESTDTN